MRSTSLLTSTRSPLTVKHLHGTESYDMVCRRDDEEMRVEVKGTTTNGAQHGLRPHVGPRKAFTGTAGPLALCPEGLDGALAPEREHPAARSGANPGVRLQPLRHHVPGRPGELLVAAPASCS